MTSNDEVRHEDPEADTRCWRRAMLAQSAHRTRLSNERTFLAWVRSSLAFVTLGFVVQRFDMLLAQRGHTGFPTEGLVARVPLLLFGLGATIVTMSAVQYFRIRNAIRSGSRGEQTGIRDSLVVICMAFLLIVSAIFLLLRP